MDLKPERFMSRVLWHVPERGQHNVRYYGLYVPGARRKRDLIRAGWGDEQEETVVKAPKPARRCARCGGSLFHRSSTRRKISSIRYASPHLGLGALSNKPVELTGPPSVPAFHEFGDIFLHRTRQLT
jgi:hypothetical protein